jgi:hypothetical protein
MDAIVAQPAYSHEAIDVRQVLTTFLFVVDVASLIFANFTSWVFFKVFSTD